MDTQEFEKLVKRYAKEIKTYAELRFPAEAANTALRFINGNFRAQGWQLFIGTHNDVHGGR